jgi:7-carboxy-7-deazaguanine synthase
MRIAEIYRSIQGEGFLTGTESAFVRASGCNLRCWYCDTPYTSWAPEGEDLGVEEIVAQVDSQDCHHVVLTGGEPMLFAELIPLSAALKAAGRHITIETAGTLYLPVECDLMSISPKLSGSTPDNSSTRGATAGLSSSGLSRQWSRRHERARHAPDVVRRLVREYPYQVKFVVDSPADCGEVEQYLQWFPEIERSRVMLMPQGTDVATLNERGTWLEPYCRERRLHYCPRRQIEWFGFVRAT